MNYCSIRSPNKSVSLISLFSSSQNSAVSGPRGIAVGDQVTSVGGCRVTSVPDWVTCITVSMQEKSSGFCMPVDLVKQQDVSRTRKTIIISTVIIFLLEMSLLFRKVLIDEWEEFRNSSLETDNLSYHTLLLFFLSFVCCSFF